MDLRVWVLWPGVLLKQLSPNVFSRPRLTCFRTSRFLVANKSTSLRTALLPIHKRLLVLHRQHHNFLGFHSTTEKCSSATPASKSVPQPTEFPLLSYTSLLRKLSKTRTVMILRLSRPQGTSLDSQLGNIRSCAVLRSRWLNRAKVSFRDRLYCGVTWQMI